MKTSIIVPKNLQGYQFVEFRRTIKVVKKLEYLWWTVALVKSVQGQEEKEGTRGEVGQVGLI
jgi:hypothetical protein